MQIMPPKNDKSKSFMIKRKQPTNMMNRFSVSRNQKENQNMKSSRSRHHADQMISHMMKQQSNFDAKSIVISHVGSSPC